MKDARKQKAEKRQKRVKKSLNTEAFKVVVFLCIYIGALTLLNSTRHTQGLFL
jgi:hypothetical protein